MSQSAVAKKRSNLFLPFAESEDLDPCRFPQLYNLSAGLAFEYIPRPKTPKVPECVWIDPTASGTSDQDRKTDLELFGTLAQWGMAWEAAQLRHEMFGDELPAKLTWLSRYKDENIYLLLRTRDRYDALAPLYHMLPLGTLRKFGLPALKRGLWPMPGHWHRYRQSDIFPADFRSRVSRAFAYHVWPLLDPRSRLQHFSQSEPTRLLAHNLDYWLPFAHMVAEDRMTAFPRVKVEDAAQRQRLNKVRRAIPDDVEVDRPLMGGAVWIGEEDAQEATRELVEMADRHGNLRALIDTIRSTRVDDDFSPCWSYAREDFERKVFKKRSKIKVSFVELPDTIPVHGPESEVIDKVLFEDFIATLDPKEKRIVIIIRSGVTKIGDISQMLGYANHSPVSKALAKIIQKAKRYLD